MDVLETSDSSKLPPEVAALQDADKPLPADVRFFEERFTYATLAKQLGWAIALIVVAPLVLVGSVYIIFKLDIHRTVFGTYTDFQITMMRFLYAIPILALVMLAFGIWLLCSLGPKFKIMQRQQNGSACRYGVYLVDDLLVSYTWFETKVIPREHFKGLKEGAVEYNEAGQTKSFDLPATLVGTDLHSLKAAINAWAS
jgi:hypothetical protein